MADHSYCVAGVVLHQNLAHRNQSLNRLGWLQPGMAWFVMTPFAEHVEESIAMTSRTCNVETFSNLNVSAKFSEIHPLPLCPLFNNPRRHGVGKQFVKWQVIRKTARALPAMQNCNWQHNCQSLPFALAPQCAK